MEPGSEFWTLWKAPPIGLVTPRPLGAGGPFPAIALATVAWFLLWREEGKCA